MKQKQLVGAAAFLFLLICFACLFIEPGSGIWQERLNEVQEKRWDTMVEVMQQMRKKDRAQVFRSTNFVWLGELSGCLTRFAQCLRNSALLCHHYHETFRCQLL